MRSPARTRCGSTLAAIDDADREPDEVELARLEQAGMLRHLAAEQRAAARCGNLRRHRRRSRRSPRGRAGRPRCSRGRTTVPRLAPRCRRPTSRRSRCRSCRGDRRGGRSATSCRRRRWTTRAAGRRTASSRGRTARRSRRVADDLAPERRPDVLLDALDGLLAGRDVDTGRGVGQPLVGSVALRRRVTRADRRCRTRAGSGSPPRARASCRGRGPAPDSRR